MLGNTNASKQPTEYVEVPKYVGVASIKIVAVNPNNAKLRSLGWQVPEGADEPKYIVEKTLDDGTIRKSTRIRFMAQIQDFDDKPIVALDFWIRPNVWLNKDGSKCQIIDTYGRTAWATKEELKNNAIPQYASGPAKIAKPYKPSHPGEERLVRFLMKYLVCTPFESYDENSGKYVKNANPGQLTIDDWKALCDGNVREIVGYLATRPDNLLKVILGVSQTEDNKVYQTFIDDVFIGNGASPKNGEYATASKIIDKLMNDGYHDNYQYSAAPVVPFVITPTEVKPDKGFNTAESAAQASSENVDALFSSGDALGAEDDDDLPFEV